MSQSNFLVRNSLFKLNFIVVTLWFGVVHRFIKLNIVNELIHHSEYTNGPQINIITLRVPKAIKYFVYKNIFAVIFLKIPKHSSGCKGLD